MEQSAGTPRDRRTGRARIKPAAADAPGHATARGDLPVGVRVQTGPVVPGAPAEPAARGEPPDLTDPADPVTPDALVRVRRELEAAARFAEWALASDASLEEVLEVACRAACEGSGVGRSKILLPEPGGGSLQIVAGVGWAPGTIGMRVSAARRSVVGPALAHGESTVVRDLRSDPRFDPIEPLRSHGIVSVVNVPILSGGTVRGVVELDDALGMRFGADELAFLRCLAGTIGQWMRLADAERAARHAAQRERRTEGRLQIALGAARMGTWIRDLRTGELELDDSLRRLTGMGREDSTNAAHLAPVHPDDRPMLAAACERSARTGADLDLEFRFALPDGALRWLHACGQVVRGAGGWPAILAGACVDVTERKEGELRLQRAHRVRSEFLAMLAHELRGPMAPVRNALAVLERSTADPARTRAALGVMRRQLGHLARLLGDLLEVSRIDRGRIELRLETAPLATSLSDAIETVQPMIEARSQQLSLTLPDPSLRIRADTVRLTQVVANLLHNAAKFTPEGGRIGLRAGSHADDVEIVVQDEGRGIPPELLPHIFGLFEQGDTVPLARSDGGLGLGLPLARRLVEMHGGTLTAESPGAGRGATFTIRLPRDTDT